MSEEKKGQTAKEVAEAMVANMAANMKDPEKFWADKDRMEDEVRKKVIEKRKLREAEKKKEIK